MNQYPDTTASSNSLVTTTEPAVPSVQGGTDSDAPAQQNTDIIVSTTATAPSGVDANEEQVAVRPQQFEESANIVPAIGRPLKEVRPEIAIQARPYLNGDMQELVQAIYSLALNTANISGVQIDRIDIDLRYSSRSRQRNPKMLIVVKTPPSVRPSQANSFWDAWGFSIEKMERRLSLRARRLLNDSVSFKVDWVEQHAS